MPIESLLIGCITWCSRLVYERVSNTRTIDEAFVTRTQAISFLANRFWRKRRYVRAIFCLYARDVQICKSNRSFQKERVLSNRGTLVGYNSISSIVITYYVYISSIALSLLDSPFRGTRHNGRQEWEIIYHYRYNPNSANLHKAT